MKILINILPKPESKGYLVTVLLVLLSLFILGSTWFAHDYYRGLEQENNQLEREMRLVELQKQRLVNEQLQRQQQLNDTTLLSYYQRIDGFFRTIYIEPTEMIEEVVSLLPEEATLVNYRTDTIGELQLEGYFKHREDVALMLHRLLASELVVDAYIRNLLHVGEGYRASYFVESNILTGGQPE
jgi:hypothetical protein